MDLLVTAVASDRSSIAFSCICMFKMLLNPCRQRKALTVETSESKQESRDSGQWRAVAVPTAVMHRGRETQTLGRLLVYACKIHIKALTNRWVKPSLRIFKSYTSGEKVCVEEQPAEYPSLTLLDLCLRAHQRAQRLTQWQRNALTAFSSLAWWHFGLLSIN